jgi:hypothetical protein
VAGLPSGSVSSPSGPRSFFARKSPCGFFNKTSGRSEGQARERVSGVLLSCARRPFMDRPPHGFRNRRSSPGAPIRPMKLLGFGASASRGIAGRGQPTPRPPDRGVGGGSSCSRGFANDVRPNTAPPSGRTPRAQPSGLHGCLNANTLLATAKLDRPDPCPLGSFG